MNPPSHELQQLVALYFARQASAQEVARLSELLRTDRLARDYYLETADVHASLAIDETLWANHHAPADRILPLPPVPPAQSPSAGKPWKIAAMVAVFAVCAALAGWWGGNHFGQPAVTTENENAVSSPSLAVLSRALNAQWGEGSSNLNAGAELRAGRLDLAQGTVQVDFYSGVRLVIVGPAELELRSRREAWLQRGKLTCEVSEQGRGFRILAPGLQVVDLGTIFGVKVLDDGRPEVHVLEGRVAVAPTGGGRSTSLNQSEALRLSNGTLTSTEFKGEEFPRSADLRQDDDAEAARRFAAWREFSANLDRDPTVLSHFTFEGNEADSGGSARNLAQAPGRGSDGMIMGAHQAEGRWPGKGALEFRGRGDRVLFGIPGRHESFTFAVWVRVDAYRQQVTALLVAEESSRWRGLETAGLTEVAGENGFRPLRWELRDDGQLAVNWERLKPASGKHWEIHWADTDLKPDRLGTWTLLATVVDHDHPVVAHYVNGREVARRPTEIESAFALTRLCLGNLSSTEAEAKAGIRYDFFGRMDEVLIAARPFTASEIARLYEAGKP